MTAPLLIPFLRSPVYEPGDVVVAEVDGVVLPDRWPAAGLGRDRQGFGFGDPGGGAVPFGRLVVVGAAVPFGAGVFGVGAEDVELRTRQLFAAGDYVVRLQVGDGLPASDASPSRGNVEGWSEPFTVYHRPTAERLPVPRNLRRDGATLRWDF